MIIKCKSAEKTLLKRSIKRCDCNKGVCGFDKQCTKPEDMTCGEYIISLIKWEMEDNE